MSAKGLSMVINTRLTYKPFEIQNPRTRVHTLNLDVQTQVPLPQHTYTREDKIHIPYYRTLDCIYLYK